MLWCMYSRFADLQVSTHAMGPHTFGALAALRRTYGTPMILRPGWFDPDAKLPWWICVALVLILVLGWWRRFSVDRSAPPPGVEVLESSFWVYKSKVDPMAP